MLEFIQLVGLPGSGKSSYAEATFPYHAIISNDQIIQAIADNMDKPFMEVYPHVAEASNKICHADIIVLSYSGENLVIDRTNMTVASRAQNFKLLYKPELYKKTAIYFDTPKELIKLRLAKRNSSGKVIADEMLEQFEARFQMPTQEEGFDEVITIRT